MECPGEDQCRRLPGLPLTKRDTTPETECPRCLLRATKPGFYERISPGELSRVVNRTLTLDRLRSRGASFAYPDGLAAWEWSSLDILELAERRSRSEDADKPSPAPRNEAERKAQFQSATLAEIKRQAKAE